MALGVIAKLYGRERAEEVARMTEYEWRADPHHDPFHADLNQGDVAAFLAALGRA